MTSEAELILEIFRILDSQQESTLKEIYSWLSLKIQEQEEDNLSDLERGYREMAADEEREKEAMEWAL